MQVRILYSNAFATVLLHSDSKCIQMHLNAYTCIHIHTDIQCTAHIPDQLKTHECNEARMQFDVNALECNGTY